MQSPNEVIFDLDDFIVSKTDPTGTITYVNRTFLDVSGFEESELLGRPHSMIRHADTPRAVFEVFWQHLLSGREVFAYVKNRCKEPDQYYWVFAHVTPSRNSSGEVVGFHSARRVPDRGILEGTIIPLYAELRRLETDAPDRRTGLARSRERLQQLLDEAEAEWDEFVFSL